MLEVCGSTVESLRHSSAAFDALFLHADANLHEETTFFMGICEGHKDPAAKNERTIFRLMEKMRKRLVFYVIIKTHVGALCCQSLKEPEGLDQSSRGKHLKIRLLSF